MHSLNNWWWGVVVVTVQDGEITDVEAVSMRTLEARYSDDKTIDMRGRLRG